MATDDYTVDPGEENARESSEQRQDKSKASSSSGSSSSSPGIISSTSQFQTQPSAKVVQPGQSLITSNNIRHITLDAFRVSNNYILIHVTQKPSSGSGSGYDEAILLTDTTGDGINFDSGGAAGSYNTTTIAASYSSASTLINSADATQRNYDVTFTSGVVRSFTLTIPGKRQSFEQLFGSTGNYAWAGNTSSCNLTTNVNWTSILNTNSNQATVSTGSMYIQTWPINDPSNVYYSGDAAFDINSSQVLNFDHNTENAGSFINLAFADGFLRNSNNSFGGYGVPDQTNGSIQTVESYIVYLTDGYGALNSIPSYNARESATSSLIHNNRVNAGIPPGQSYNYNQIGFGQFQYSGFGPSPRFPFVHSITFSENLQSCSSGQTIDACNDINSANYIGYDTDGDGIFYEDCNGVAISSTIYTDANTTYTGTCCPDCTAFQFSAQFTDPTTAGGTDGVVELTVADNAGAGTGTANYTFVIEPLNSINAGKGAGVNIGSGAVSDITFTFGFQTDLAQDLLTTTADPTYAVSALKGYIPAVVGGGAGASTRGLDAGQYNVYVFDSNTTASCLAQTTITLTDPPEIIGCTDSDSLTYNASATTNNPAACWYCDALNGVLENGSNTPVGGSNGSIIQTSTSGFMLSSPAATTTASTNIDISITVYPENTYWTKALEIVNSSGVINGQTKIELYKWDSQLPTANSSFNTLVGFNAGTTLVGTVTQNILSGGNFITVLTATSVGTAFTYGYYSVKFYVSDPDDNVEVEECYAIMDVVIPVVVCESTPGQGTAQDGSGGTVLITDTNLYIHDPAICLVVNNFCCTSALLALNASSPVCSRTYTFTAICTDDPYTVEATIQYKNNTTGGVWAATGIWHILTPNSVGEVSVVITEASLINAFGSADYRLVVNSFYNNSAQCTTHTNVLNIAPPLYGCTDPLATTASYNPLAQCDDGSCVMPILGCTDPTAFNYLVSANTDDGSCIPFIYGCTDPTAFNYDASLNVNTDDGSCINAVLGCTDPAALNTNVSANTSDGSCLYCNGNEPIATFNVFPASVGADCISNSDGNFEMTVNMPLCAGGSWTYDIDMPGGFYDGNLYADGATLLFLPILSAGNYAVTITDCYGCTTTETVSIPTDSSSCGCTDPAAENYSAAATIDDGSCLYCGCDDPNATNYNPNAFNTCSPNPCTYFLSPPPCIPPGIDTLLNKTKDCIAVNGFKYYNKLVTGLSDDCSIMNAWKLILIDYLLNRRGLACVYNCADANTPNASEVYISCSDRWITGGPHTGLNDVAVTGTGVGTTSTAAMFTTLNLTSNLSTNGQLFNGDVIKHHTSGNIWIFNGPSIINGTPIGATSVIGIDPETASGTLSGYWEYCTDSLRYTENTYNTNYLDNFTNFVNTFCTDCGNSPILLTGSRSNEDIPDITQGVDGIEDLEI